MKQLNHKNSFLFVTIMLVSISAQAQSNYSGFYLQKDSFSSKLAELKNEYGRHKVMPPELETECLTALSFYPELKDCYIEFRFGKIQTTMESRPKFSFLFTSKEKRKNVN